MIDFVRDNLYNLLEIENLSSPDLIRFQYMLDITCLLCIRRKKIGQNLPKNLINFTKRIGFNNDLDHLVDLAKPLMLWLESTLYNKNRYEIFKRVWLVLVELSNTLSPGNEFNITEITLPILYKIHEFCLCSSPSIHMLSFLIEVLSVFTESNQELKQFVKEFVLVFSDCIPHSIYDESFTVFDILIKLSSRYLNEEIIRVS